MLNVNESYPLISTVSGNGLCRQHVAIVNRNFQFDKLCKLANP